MTTLSMTSRRLRRQVSRTLRLLGLRPFAVRCRAQLVEVGSRVGLVSSEFEVAKRYVSSRPKQGRLHLELLRLEGCTREAHVLEVGCGCLNGGQWMMRFLNAGNYVAIEPNQWLLDVALGQRKVRRIVSKKKPLFLNRTDFDASDSGELFDFVFSHSVLSHCSHAQLREFLRNTSKVLKPDGCILASIRLGEGNAHGSSGSPDGKDSLSESWQYPGVSYFAFSTVMATAKTHGLGVVVKPEYTKRLVAEAPSHIHDWLVFRPVNRADELS